VNLHDWIDELCDVLDLDTDVDEGLILDLAKVVATNVERPAAPVSAYLLGLAAGQARASAEKTEALAGEVQALAERWDRPADTAGSDDDDIEEPEDLDLDFGEEMADLE